jgi:hypothetical protein
MYFRELRSRGSAVGTTTGYGLDDRGVGVSVPVRSRIFSSPCRPNSFCGPTSLLSNRYQKLFPQGKSGWGVKLIIPLQLLPTSRERGSIQALPHTV